MGYLPGERVMKFGVGTKKVYNHIIKNYFNMISKVQYALRSI